MASISTARNWAIPIVFVIMILLTGRVGYEQVDRVWMLGGIILFALIMSGFAEMWFKYNSPQVITDLRAWSLNPKDIKKDGDWTFITLGGISKYFDFKGTEGTIFTLTEYTYKIGNNLSVLARLEKIEPFQLDSRWRSMIDIQGLHPPYFLAAAPLDPTINPEDLKKLLDSKEGVSYSQLSTLVEELKNKNGMITVYEQILNKAFGSIEGAVNWGRRIGKKESLVDKMFREPKEDD